MTSTSGGGGLPGEADGVVEEDLVCSTLDDQGRQAGQIGENRADEAEGGVLPGGVVGDPGLERVRAEQRVSLALGLHWSVPARVRSAYGDMR